MKKLFLMFATVALLLGVQSCKEKQSEETATEEVVTTEEAVVTTDTTANAVDTTDGRGVKTPTEPTK